MLSKQSQQVVKRDVKAFLIEGLMGGISRRKMRRGRRMSRKRRQERR
jgi:hypothetical protein